MDSSHVPAAERWYPSAIQGRARLPASLSWIFRMFHEYFDWERVIDHVATVVLVVLVRLEQTARVPGPRQ